MSSNTDAFADLVRSAAEVCALLGQHAVRVLIHTLEDPEHPISLPVSHLLSGSILRSPSAPAPQGQAQPAQPAEEGALPLSPVPAAVLAALEQAGKPLTMTMLRIELERTGKRFHKEAIEKHLEAMIEDGTIELPSNGRPPGYRLITAEERKPPAEGPSARK